MSLQFPSHGIQHPCARTFQEDKEIIANNLIPFTCHNTRRRKEEEGEKEVGAGRR